MKLPFYQPDPSATTRFLFFTGKGGVGKASLSCATALKLAGPGKRVLLSGSCTVEIAAFDEFSGLIGDPATSKDYDHVIFDTAPTGHTLLLLDASEAYLREVVEKHATRTAWLRWQAEEPTGPDALARLAASKPHATTPALP